MTARIATRRDWRKVMEWNTDMSAAPHAQPLMIKAGGMEFEAELILENALNDVEEWVSQWVANTEVYPECWSEGACWESNADECMSAQPEAWRYLSERTA